MRRFDRYVGFVSPPTSFDVTPQRLSVGRRRTRLDHLGDSIAGLRDAHAEIVLQVTVILNWVALADALLEIGAKRISIAAGYYRPSWTAASVHFFTAAGFEVAWAGDIIDQGLVADEAEKLEIEAATRWDYPNQIVQGTCIGAAEAAPDCDAICQTGAGMRTSYVVVQVEAQTGKPLVATDLAAHWAIMRTAGLRSRAGFGRLLDSLA